MPGDMAVVSRWTGQAGGAVKGTGPVRWQGARSRTSGERAEQATP